MRHWGGGSGSQQCAACDLCTQMNSWLPVAPAMLPRMQDATPEACPSPTTACKDKLHKNFQLAKLQVGAGGLVVGRGWRLALAMWVPHRCAVIIPGRPGRSGCHRQDGMLGLRHRKLAGSLQIYPTAHRCTRRLPRRNCAFSCYNLCLPVHLAAPALGPFL